MSNIFLKLDFSRLHEMAYIGNIVDSKNIWQIWDLINIKSPWLDAMSPNIAPQVVLFVRFSAMPETIMYELCSGYRYTWRAFVVNHTMKVWENIIESRLSIEALRPQHNIYIISVVYMHHVYYSVLYLQHCSK